MPGRDVNVWITDWTDLLNTVPFPQWEVHIRVEWTDEEGNPHSHSGTYTFPNILSGVPLSRMRRYMEEIILREARIQLGIDPEE